MKAGDSRIGERVIDGARVGQENRATGFAHLRTFSDPDPMGAVFRLLAALAISLPLAGCYMGDPAVHVAFERDFSGSVDPACIETALRAVATNVRRGTYQADGNGPRGFKRGTTVTQFGYDDPTSRGYYSLDVAAQPDGSVHYWHEWGKIGTKVSADEQRSILPLLMRADRSVAQRCGLSFTGTAPLVGDG